MAYKRKTIDTWEIQGYYAHGFETVTAELTFNDARQQIKTYRENEPKIPFRIKYVRERIQNNVSNFPK